MVITTMPDSLIPSAKTALGVPLVRAHSGRKLGTPVLAISASDSVGISEGVRLRTENLRGSSALAYEADVVLVLNEKYDVVARHHLVYGAANAERFRNYAVLTIEKNRRGKSGVDLEFTKDFVHFRFQSHGRFVEEQLIDEMLFPE